jgi:diacylglycerol kinase family enzyme
VKPYLIVNPVAGSFGDIHLRLKQLHRLDAQKCALLKRAGHAETRYLRSAAAGLPELQAYRTTMIDHTEKLIIDLYNVVLANGQFAGGGLPIVPQANLSDGLLDFEPAAKLFLTR